MTQLTAGDREMVDGMGIQPVSENADAATDRASYPLPVTLEKRSRGELTDDAKQWQRAERRPNGLHKDVGDYCRRRGFGPHLTTKRSMPTACLFRESYNVGRDPTEQQTPVLLQRQAEQHRKHATTLDRSVIATGPPPQLGHHTNSCQHPTPTQTIFRIVFRHEGGQP